MATVSVTIRRPNGVDIVASGDVDDALVVDIASTLGAILFDASTAPATTTTTTDPSTTTTTTTATAP